MKNFLKESEEKFLKGFGFNILSSKFCSNVSKLKKAIIFVGGFPIVMKPKFQEKYEQSKIVKNVSTYSESLKVFKNYKKRKGFLGIAVQKNINFSDEFRLGIKKTTDFGNVLFFGNKEKKICFRVCSIDKNEAKRMIKEIVGKKYSFRRISLLSKILLKFCEIGENYPNILKLNINSLVFNGDNFVILDFDLVFS